MRQIILCQVCDGDIVLYDQDGIDSFQSTYPNCTIINGNITIVAGTGGPYAMVNLNGLQNIIQVTGDLNIHVNSYATVFSLNGLNSLTTVGGYLMISDSQGPSDPAVIVDLSPLSNLQHVDSLILHLPIITDMSAFNNLSHANTIEIQLGDAGTSNLENIFPAIDTIDSFLFETRFHYPYIENFTGFESLVEANAITFYNRWSTMQGPAYFSLNNFSAFHNLVSCDAIFIDRSFTNTFSCFENLSQVANSVDFRITSTTEYSTLQVLESVGSLSIDHGLQAGDLILPSLQHVQNGLSYEGLFSNIELPELNYVGGDFTITVDLAASFGLNALNINSLDSIGGNFILSESSIPDLSFLDNIEFIGGTLTFNNNDLLTDCDIDYVCNRISVSPDDVIAFENNTGCNSVGEIQAQCAGSYVQGSVFIDLNCDGILNSDDILLPGQVILGNENEPIGTTYSNGNYLVGLADFTTTEFSLNPPPGFLPANSYSITTGEAIEVFSNYDFGICFDGSPSNLSVYSWSDTQPRPGESIEYFVSITNLGSSETSAIVTFDMSSMPGASITNANGGTIDGSVVTWNSSVLPIMQSQIFSLTFLIDPATELGTIYQPLATVASDNVSIIDIDASNNSYSFTQTVVASYDPNDKTVNISAVKLDEVPAGEGVWLDYTIRFQNTGTAEAITVRLEDVIEEDLDLSTIEMLNASHDYELSFVENRKVEWLFANILLPDMITDETGSHGFIHFRIKTKNNLALTDTITNSAAIYFDFNAPIITNDASTEFYMCPDSFVVNGDEIVCQSEGINLTISGGWDIYSWWLNDVLVASSNEYAELNPSTGLSLFTIRASTEHCQMESEFEVVVEPTPVTPVITQNGNTLTATGSLGFQWYLNDEPISPQTGNSIVITESGEYGVVNSNPHCDSEMATGFFEFVGLDELSKKSSLIISPNPMNESAILKIAGIDAAEIRIIDATGRIIICEKLYSNTYSLKRQYLESGVYTVNVCETKTGKTASERLMVE